jgi:hypothetical protein
MDLVALCFNPNFTYIAQENSAYAPYVPICGNLIDIYTITHNILDIGATIFLNIELFLLLLIISITLFGGIKEDFKWLILNWTLIRLILVLYSDINMITKISYSLQLAMKPGNFWYYLYLFFNAYLNNLVLYMIFPIILNRYMLWFWFVSALSMCFSFFCTNFWTIHLGHL